MIWLLMKLTNVDIDAVTDFDAVSSGTDVVAAAIKLMLLLLLLALMLLLLLLMLFRLSPVIDVVVADRPPPSLGNLLIINFFLI